MRFFSIPFPVIDETPFLEGGDTDDKVKCEKVFFWDIVQKPRPVSLDAKNIVKSLSFQASLSSGNRKKSEGLRSGEYGGYPICTTSFFAKNCLTILAVSPVAEWLVHRTSTPQVRGSNPRLSSVDSACHPLSGSRNEYQACLGT
ncbi:hypothetical protein TNCV_3023881 [Trichonephila clavipes]|nr:hypothetical protein TNCV_3023881 [Trichonephila clavipes]